MKIYIGLGGNLGDPEEFLSNAAKMINEWPDFKSCQVSSLYRSEPVDSFGPDYLNAVMSAETDLDPEEVLSVLLKIEKNLGRKRPAGIRNAPRVIDCDLLLYGDCIKETPFLELPHPRVHERAFTLVPIIELTPDLEIPGKGLARELLEKVVDQSVELYKKPEEWFVITQSEKES
ncbi:MAG: 2-amino-4-hydroxy-6-hydroxymethyldihydropteridine diphosphokinase [Burkholderiales bacterium]|nr:2-amino-4-hydroxy-6-hydroxymethyldihydropteridine diphosphokinase [Burkholderiales bacterium]